MGFKRGLLVGFGIGYVLGAKAGRERYEQIKQAWQGFLGNPAVQRATAAGREVMEGGARKGIQAVQEGVARASSAVRDRLEGDGEPAR